MRHALSLSALAALALLATARPAAAQPDAGDIAAYLALNLTPVGALPPVVTQANIGPTATTFNLRYGRLEIFGDDALNAFGAGVQFAGGLHLQLGYGSFSDCDEDCGVFMGSLGFGRVLSSSPLGAGAEPLNFNIGLDASVGVGRPQGNDPPTALAIAGTIPVSLAAGGPGLRVVPFVAPGLGFGRLSEDDESESGLRFLLGAGVGILFDRGAINAGLQKVFIDRGETQFGVGVSLLGGR